MGDRVRTVNAVELRQADALNWIEFETVVCEDEWVELGFGEFGQPMIFSGVLMAVRKGQTLGRGWSQVCVSVFAHAAKKHVEITSTLGAHRTVTLTELDD